MCFGTNTSGPIVDNYSKKDGDDDDENAQETIKVIDIDDDDDVDNDDDDDDDEIVTPFLSVLWFAAVCFDLL